MRRSSRGDEIGAAALGGLLLLSFGFAVLPVIVSTYPPFADYLNHLARFSILARPDATSEFWSPNPAFVPNVGFDLFVVALARVLPIATAGKVGVLAAIGAFGAGFAVLHRAVHGRRSAWAASGFLLVYTYPLMVGLLNYVVGLGLMMALAAALLSSRDRLGWRLGIALVGGAALAVTHLMSFLLLLVFAPAVEFLASEGRDRLRRALVTVGALLAPLLGVLILSPTRGEVGAVVASNAGYKEAAVRLLPVTGHGRFDLGYALAVMVFGAALALRMELRPVARLGALPLLAAALWLATPYGFKTTLNVDMRLPVVVALFALLVLGPGAKTRGRAWAAGGILFLGAMRGGYLALQWRRETLAYPPVARAISSLPPATMVITLRHRQSAAWNFGRWHPTMVYAAQLGVLDGRFVSGTFDLPTQQPIVIRPRWAPIDASFEEGSADGSFTRSLREIRSRVARLGEPHPAIALWIMPKVDSAPRLPADVRPVARGEEWILATLAEPVSR